MKHKILAKLTGGIYNGVQHVPGRPSVHVYTERKTKSTYFIADRVTLVLLLVILKKHRELKRKFRKVTV